MSESERGTYTMKPKGNMCWECGKIVESFPTMTMEEISSKYAEDAPWRTLFERARLILRGTLSVDMRPQAVSKHVLLGLKVKSVLAFITEETLCKFFKSAAADLGKAVKLTTIRDAEGELVSGVLLKPGAGMPVGLPYLQVEMFSQEQTLFDDVYIDRSEVLHDQHGPSMIAWLNKAELSERLVRLSAVPGSLTWEDIQQKVQAAQQELEEREETRRRELLAADTGGLTDLAPELNQSSSRLRRPTVAPMPPPPAQSTPAKRGGRGSVARAAPRSRGGHVVGGSSRSSRHGEAPPASPHHMSSGASVLSVITAGAPSATVAGASAAIASSPAAAAAGGALVPLVFDIPEGPPLDPELARLLVSSHGKKFPGIADILRGVACKRELNGAGGLAPCFRISVLRSIIVCTYVCTQCSQSALGPRVQHPCRTEAQETGWDMCHLIACVFLHIASGM